MEIKIIRLYRIRNNMKIMFLDHSFGRKIYSNSPNWYFKNYYNNSVVT